MDYGATEQVAVVALQVVFLSPGALGAKEPAGMPPEVHALLTAVGMGIEDNEAATHAFANALASPKQALFADLMR